MIADSDPSSVENLNRALRLYRRLLLRILLIGVGGLAIAILLARLGIIILGEGLGTWALIAVLVLLLAEIWVDGRAIGRALDDPVMRTVPVLGMLSGLTVIAQRAHAMGMEWTGFLGPLRPTKR